LLNRLNAALSACTPDQTPTQALLFPEDRRLYSIGALCFSLKILEGAYRAGPNDAVNIEVADLVSRDLKQMLIARSDEPALPEHLTSKDEGLGEKDTRGVPSRFDRKALAAVLETVDRYVVVPYGPDCYDGALVHADRLVREFSGPAETLLASAGLEMDEAAQFPPGTLPRKIADIDRLAKLTALTLRSLSEAGEVADHLAGYLQSSMLHARSRTFV
jgi:hypothetical protein